MADVEIINQDLIEVAIDQPSVIEVEISTNPVVEVEVLPGGISYGGVLSLDYQLILGRLVNQPSLHKILSYSDGNLTSIEVYNDNTLTTQLLDIQFTYTSGNLTQKVLTDVVSGRVLTVTYAYTDGNLTSISEVFS